MVELKQEVSVSRVTFSRPTFHTDSFYFLPLSFFLSLLPTAPLATPLSSPACEGWTHPLDFTTRPRLGFILILKERRRAFTPVLAGATTRSEITLTLSKVYTLDDHHSLRTTLIRFPFS